MNTETSCARCGEGKLKTWAELNDDEREVVKRLPGSDDYTLAERQALHRWCTRCWHEQPPNATQA